MQPTWQFDYVAANEVMNFAANLGSSLRTLKRSSESNFIEAVSTARNSLIQEGKAVLITVWERVVDRRLEARTQIGKYLTVDKQTGEGRKGDPKTAKPHQNTPNNRKPH